jgi:hypothetical protein
MADITNPTAPSEQRIRERAYEIYLSRSGGDSDELSDWLTAEQELKQSNVQPPAAKTARAAVTSL